MRLFSKKKTAKIQICTNNIDRFYDDDQLDALDDFIDDSAVLVREMDCLSYCDECIETPYILLNRTFIAAETPEKLLERIKKHL